MSDWPFGSKRVPNRARFSQGNNNGDRSWSLTLDQIDGLTYLPPKGMHKAHTLTVRIVNLDDSAPGATLAVLDLPISSDQIQSAASLSADAVDPEASATISIRLFRTGLFRRAVRSRQAAAPAWWPSPRQLQAGSARGKRRRLRH